jgi:2-iminoacetate synthase
MLADFSLDEDAIRSAIERGRSSADRDDVALLGRARAGETIGLEETAALWFSSVLSTEQLFEAARTARSRRDPPLETFSPLYLTNTCDAECLMCGMRSGNRALVRETADDASIRLQLELLAERGMKGVALLTGEYRGERRSWAVDRVRTALAAALELGFRHILVNMGSLEEEELGELLRDVPRHSDGALDTDAKVTMCTFQETYARDRYSRFMGTNPSNPRADFGRRLANFDRSFRSGFRVANPGILVGLSPDLAFEALALVQHANHLHARGMEVYVSAPRLRPTAGDRAPEGVDDESFVRLIAVLVLALPDAKVVLTTREPHAMQQRLAPLVGVLSAGSAAVAPYSASGARFPFAASQFEVIDQRPFEEILAEHVRPGRAIVNFQPLRPAG